LEVTNNSYIIGRAIYRNIAENGNSTKKIVEFSSGISK
jgi:hypothetical protein